MWKRRILWAAWGATFALAVACLGVFVQGVVRDTRAGDPVIGVDFSAAPGSAEASFRVWGEQTYDLLISSVNHDPGMTGRPLKAAFEVEVADPGGTRVLHRTFAPGATGHRIPDTYRDARLATLDLDGSPLRSWTLRVNVVTPDPAFKTAQTHLKLYKRQDSPGMGGLMNYAIMIPGGILLLAALALAVPLAGGGARLPLLLTVFTGLAILLIPSLLKV